MSLLEKLISTPSDEGGSAGGAGYDYQVNWSISRMLELKALGQSYLFIFECHDDVCIFQDKDNGDSKISFIQVKAKDLKDKSRNKWGISELINPNGKTNSILGKLYSHTNKFGEDVAELTFVTNVYFDFLSDASDFKYDSISESQQEKIVTSLKKEFTNLSELNLTKFRFIHSSIPISGQDAHLRMVIYNYMRELFETNEISMSIIETVHEHLFKECHERCNKKMSTIKNDQELLNLKGVSSKTLDKLLIKAHESHDGFPNWEDISSELTCSFSDKADLKRSWMTVRRLWIEGELDNVMVVLKSVVNFSALNSNLNLIFETTFFNSIKENVSQDYNGDDTTLRALILWSFCNEKKVQS
jgi:hypothetical protein